MMGAMPQHGASMGSMGPMGQKPYPQGTMGSTSQQGGMMGSPMHGGMGGMTTSGSTMMGTPQQGMVGTPQQGMMGAMPQQGMMQGGMMGAMPHQGMMGSMGSMGQGPYPQGAIGSTSMGSPHVAKPVIPTKHVVLPVKVSSHHVNNTSEVLYDIEISIEEYFPDGSKAVHVHKFSESIGHLKKIHDAVYHGELVKDRTKLTFPHQGMFERKESDKKVAERMSELRVYLDSVLDAPKVLTDKTFIDSIKCDKSFELHLKHAADYMKMSKKATKKAQRKQGKMIKKVEKEEKKDLKKADKYSKKEEKYREEQYHSALKQQVYTDVNFGPGNPAGHPAGHPAAHPQGFM